MKEITTNVSGIGLVLAIRRKSNGNIRQVRPTIKAISIKLCI
jgi:hypothetical protein